MHSSSPRHPGLVLTALALAQLTIGIDYNIVFVALPDIGTGVGFSDQQLQWVVSAYAVVFGGFLLFGGRAADLAGRRRVFTIGLSLYAIASLIGGLASAPGPLIAARALQGLGGAFLAPATLSLVTTTFAEGRERNRALGIWGAAGSSGMVLGSLLGGVLTQAFGWSSVFFVNVPLAAAIALLGLRVLPADPPADTSRSFDVPGSLTVTAGATLLVFAIVEGPELGWLAPVTLAAFVAAVVLLGAFALIEKRSSDPLVPLAVFTQRNLNIGTAITFLFMATFGALAYFLTMDLQQVHGYDALTTGFAFILPCACVLIGTMIGGRMSTAFGVRVTLLTGLVTGAIGTAAFAASLDAQGSYWLMSPGIVVFSLAQGVVFTAMFSAATAGVREQFQGLASGIANSGQQIGAAVGLAVLVAITNSVSGSHPTPARLSAGLQAAVFTAAVVILLATGAALGLKKQATASAGSPGEQNPAEPAPRTHDALA
ncbi:MFS transporter [Streptomyces sp. NPDC017056]|uniref:MFS transporter n=1 Tax=Streptomyces sp. NPDC017056 TaxID=3364973 RepID=UPI0037B370CF